MAIPPFFPPFFPPVFRFLLAVLFQLFMVLTKLAQSHPDLLLGKLEIALEKSALLAAQNLIQTAPGPD